MVIAAYPSDEGCYHIALLMNQLSVDLMTLTVQSGRNGEIYSVSNGITEVFKDADYLGEGEISMNVSVQWLVSICILWMKTKPSVRLMIFECQYEYYTVVWKHFLTKESWIGEEMGCEVSKLTNNSHVLR